MHRWHPTPSLRAVTGAKLSTVDPTDHSVTSTKFPKGWSATGTASDPRVTNGLRHAPLKRRIPRAGSRPETVTSPGLPPKVIQLQ